MGPCIEILFMKYKLERVSSDFSETHTHTKQNDSYRHQCAKAHLNFILFGYAARVCVCCTFSCVS